MNPTETAAVATAAQPSLLPLLAVLLLGVALLGLSRRFAHWPAIGRLPPVQRIIIPFIHLDQLISGLRRRHGWRVMTLLLGGLFSAVGVFYLSAPAADASLREASSLLTQPPLSLWRGLIFVTLNLVIGLSLLSSRWLPLTRLLLLVRLIDLAAAWVVVGRAGLALMTVTAARQLILRDVVITLVALIVAALLCDARRRSG